MAHKSRAVFLVNDNVRGVLGIYEAETPERPAKRTFFKTFDKGIGVGDFVLVPTSTRHNMTVNKIVAVDVEVDDESETPCDWIIGKVDTAAYQKLLAQEGEMLNVIKSAEKTKKRKELADAILADAGDKIKTLSIATRDGQAKLEG